MRLSTLDTPSGSHAAARSRTRGRPPLTPFPSVMLFAQRRRKRRRRLSREPDDPGGRTSSASWIGGRPCTSR